MSRYVDHLIEGGAPYADPYEPTIHEVVDAYREAITRMRVALFECAKHAGADVSDGQPTSVPIDVWAVREVTRKRISEDPR